MSIFFFKESLRKSNRFQDNSKSDIPTLDFLASRSCSTQAVTISKTASSFGTTKSSYSNKRRTSFNPSSRNSCSFRMFSEFFFIKLREAVKSSGHACDSANFAIPRQFDGCNCLRRNSQHATTIFSIWSKRARNIRFRSFRLKRSFLTKVLVWIFDYESEEVVYSV